VNRILVNGRFLGQRITGVQRFARELLKAMDALLLQDPVLGDRMSLTVVTPPGTAPSLALTAVSTREIGRFRGQLWEQVELPSYAGRARILNLCNTAPLAGRDMIATIYDASVYAVPDAYSIPFRAWYRILLPRVGRRARRVVTSSHFSRQELQRYTGITPERIAVIPGSGEHILTVPSDERILSRLRLCSRSYALAVSSHSRHKNLAGVAQAAAMLGLERFPVVLAGEGNPRIFNSGATGGNGRLQIAGFVSDAELRALYENAACFVYPSFYEGFGLPPLEAMACGCPVVVSRAASLPEVCGDAALYCDPSDPADIARGIQQILADSALADDLRRRSREQAQRFSWTRSARALLELMKDLPE
jgi:glycosyltransferase involved in cell wall biosynthesis